MRVVNNDYNASKVCCSTCGVDMKAQTKAMQEIRKIQEEKGSKISKPGKADKVNLSHFKLKTVLGRGGYGKARMVKR